MESLMNHVRRAISPLIATVALLFAVGPTGSGCDSAQEAVDNFDSQAACQDYCAKKFDCQDHDATSAETDDCVGACRNSIEDDCGNEHQAEANDRIGECVDKGCAEFGACMVFEAAPACYGFVNELES